MPSPILVEYSFCFFRNCVLYLTITYGSDRNLTISMNNSKYLMNILNYQFWDLVLIPSDKNLSF
jgi:hypothetical protein